eukprot:scaffold127461_cov26-Prasinocladus_malaysianus.AAC.2
MSSTGSTTGSSPEIALEAMIETQSAARQSALAGNGTGGSSQFTTRHLWTACLGLTFAGTQTTARLASNCKAPRPNAELRGESGATRVPQCRLHPWRIRTGSKASAPFLLPLMSRQDDSSSVEKTKEVPKRENMHMTHLLDEDQPYVPIMR